MAQGVRVDVWLWAVRIYRTRSSSNAACKSGSVRVNGSRVKPSHLVVIGDVVHARAAGRQRILEVRDTPSKRLGAALAADTMIDSSPAPAPRETRPLAQAVREPGAGRPTKRDRRQIDRLRREADD